MNTKLSYRSMVHLLFGGGLLLALSISIAIKLFSGHTFLSATLDGLGQIRPIEYLMYFLFWYWLARGQQQYSRPGLTSLNLRGGKI